MFSKKQQTSPDEILSPLPQPFRSALVAPYNGERQLGSDGEPHSLNRVVLIGRDQGMWLYKLTRVQNKFLSCSVG
jgi:hypothetical protein